MTGKEANEFFKDKFKQSLQMDMVFWISTIASIVFILINFDWYPGFLGFLYFNWVFFGSWIGILFLLTRRCGEIENLKSHHLKSLCRILLLVMIMIVPLTALVVLPILGVRWIVKTAKKGASNEDPLLEKSNEPTSQVALASVICSGLAAPLLVGITILQDIMISLRLLQRTAALASVGIGFWTGLILSIVGIILWAISRKHEGRHVWNFWAMRLIIVNVILAPFVLIFVLFFAIARVK